MSLFYGNGIALTEKTLDLLWGRQNLTVNNIANVDTPNFKSKYLTFENELLHRISTAEKGGQKKVHVAQAINGQHQKRIQQAGRKQCGHGSGTSRTCENDL